MCGIGHSASSRRWRVADRDQHADQEEEQEEDAQQDLHAGPPCHGRNPHREFLADTFALLGRSGSMANSCFGALVLIVLLVAVAVFLLTPHDRVSTAFHSSPAPLWSTSQR